MAITLFKPTPKAKPESKKPQIRPRPTLFEQLFPCSWRDIVFPISSISVQLSQDLVEHRYWGVDAANVESTGRAPMEISAEIPFVNGIVPGKGENWGVLYPTEFRKFLKAFADRSSGVLNHPELSGILCKPKSLEFALDAQTRNGVIVRAQWIETTEPNEDLDLRDPFTNDSPVQIASQTALSLDASKEDITGLAPQAPVFEESFESMVNKLRGVVDGVGTTVSLLVNKPNQILYRVKLLQNSVERTKNVITWPIEDACERLKNAMHDVSEKTVIGTGAALTVSRPIGRHTLKARTTLSTMPSLVPARNSVDELLALNPSLASRPEVPEGTVIRYYTDGASQGSAQGVADPRGQIITTSQGEDRNLARLRR